MLWHFCRQKCVYRFLFALVPHYISIILYYICSYMESNCDIFVRLFFCNVAKKSSANDVSDVFSVSEASAYRNFICYIYKTVLWWYVSNPTIVVLFLFFSLFQNSSALIYSVLLLFYVKHDWQNMHRVNLLIYDLFIQISKLNSLFLRGRCRHLTRKIQFINERQKAIHSTQYIYILKPSHRMQHNQNEN